MTCSKKWGISGFWASGFLKKYGGEGLDYWYETVVMEELAHIHCGGVPMAIAVQMSMATPGHP